mmetsp:Transcript_15996/g.62248  ORF Transcript_15996/g.62248 Transcript_15996/m.62248 type:complete len:237 (+) Transcript_15996:618-1328(+)
MMSTWSQSAPSAIILDTSPARLPWSADSNDGHTVARGPGEASPRPRSRSRPRSTRSTLPCLRMSCFVAAYVALYAAYGFAYNACTSGRGMTTPSSCTIASTAANTSPPCAPAATAARTADPSAGASAHLVRLNGIPATSAWICSQRSDRVAPPATTTDSGRYPFARIASKMSLVPKEIPSRMERYTCARPCRSVRPETTPRDSGSTCGVLFPCRCSCITRPSHPGGISAAAALTSS